MKTIEELLTENLALAAEIERLNTYIQDSGILERENRSKRATERKAQIAELNRIARERSAMLREASQINRMKG